MSYSGRQTNPWGRALLVLGREHFERRLNDTTAETEDKVERGLLLDIVVRQGATILQLLPGKDQAKEHRLESNIRALEGASLAHRCWSGGMLLWCIVVSDKRQQTHILTHPSLS